MSQENKDTELNGADIFSDWDNLTGIQTGASSAGEISLDNLMTDGGEDHWLHLFQKTNLSGMDLVALRLLPDYTNNFKAEQAQLKAQTHLFLINLAHTHKNDLRIAGLSEEQIDQLSMGILPINWTIHLKYPLAYGGTITINNLVLMPQQPFHEDLHHFLNQQTITDAGVITPNILYVPAPKSPVYIPFNSNEMATQVIHFETTGGNK
ncbi:MAG: hypothetical protein II938_00325 [Alphaproteobacteria bacterium]|nr:hypothetical protein [Alphaproteobacteria bacterium]